MPKISELTLATRAQVNTGQIPIVSDGQTLKTDVKSLYTHRFTFNATGNTDKWYRLCQSNKGCFLISLSFSYIDKVVFLVSSSEVVRNVVLLSRHIYASQNLFYIKKIRTIVNSSGETWVDVQINTAGTTRNFSCSILPLDGVNFAFTFFDGVETTETGGVEVVLPSYNFNLSEFQYGSIYANNTTSGSVTFGRALSKTPTILISNATGASNPAISAYVANESSTGFTWRLSSAGSQLYLKWIALAM